MPRLQQSSALNPLASKPSNAAAQAAIGAIAAASGANSAPPPPPISFKSQPFLATLPEQTARNASLERDQVADMITASEAKVSEGVVRAISDLRVEMASMNGRMLSKASFYVTTAGTGLAILGVLIAVLAFGGDRFSQGMEVATVAQAVPQPAPVAETVVQPIPPVTAVKK